MNVCGEVEAMHDLLHLDWRTQVICGHLVSSFEWSRLDHNISFYDIFEFCALQIN